jgi:hypothetical protein
MDLNAEFLLGEPSERARTLVENQWVCKHLKEIVLVLDDDLRVSCDSKLSTIQHHDPRPGLEAADVLDTLADVLLKCMDRFREDIVRSTGVS